MKEFTYCTVKFKGMDCTFPVCIIEDKESQDRVNILVMENSAISNPSIANDLKIYAKLFYDAFSGKYYIHNIIVLTSKEEYLDIEAESVNTPVDYCIHLWDNYYEDFSPRYISKDMAIDMLGGTRFKFPIEYL